MADPMPANSIELGRHAYLLRSPRANTTDCFVMAHGGSVDRTQKFTVPSSITIRFFVRHAESNKAPDGPGEYIASQIAEMAGKGRIGTDGVGYTYGPGSDCQDYILAKAFGRHWKVETAERASYQSVRQMIDTHGAPGTGLNWVPHVVTVRHRTNIFLSTNVWLSSLVKETSECGLGITTIYCANCRDNDEPDSVKLLKTVGKPSLGSRSGR